jgi:hypothetical protein
VDRGEGRERCSVACGLAAGFGVVPAVLGGIAPVRLGPSPCAVILGLNRGGMAPRPEIKIHAANPGRCLLVAMHKPTPRESFPVTGQYFRVTGQCFRMTGQIKVPAGNHSPLGEGCRSRIPCRRSARGADELRERLLKCAA